MLVQGCHFAWLAQHPLDVAQDIGKAERAAFACKHSLQPLVQLAAFLPLDLTAGVDNLLLKWSYVFSIKSANKLHPPR